jgi:3-hydroxyacyl-CoA dehydrogenase
VKTVAVLGAGLVGSLIARDLARDPSLAVVAVDASGRES